MTRRFPVQILRGLPLARALVLALGSLWVSAPAQAGEAEKAEHIQLYEEMRKYAARNAWAGVESNYKRLLELEKKGEVLTYEDHRLGAEAARAVGDIAACRERLVRASGIKKSDEVASFITDIDANFGAVDIKFDKAVKAGASAVPVMPPFAPEQRQAIAFANVKLAAHEPFKGLLPTGDYTIGETTFTVAAGKPAVVAVGGGAAVATRDPKPSGGDFEVSGGFRLSVGGSFTSGGASETSPITGNFGGAGVRAGIGYEFAVSPVFGVLGQFGYHNFVSEPGAGGQAVDPLAFQGSAISSNYLHLGYGWLAGTARFSGLKVGLGPVVGIGKAQVTPAQAGPGGLTVVPYQANLSLAGVGGSVDYGIVKFGDYQIALGLEAGAMLDAERAWPWGELALTFEPSFRGDN